jgi:predicted murein hydrolase (TIGR00659 family)
MSGIWVYLSASPLLWLTLTVLAYVIAVEIFERLGRTPWVNTVLIATALIVAILLPTGTTYDQYFAGAQFVHFLLGPTTVALAVPLYRNLAVVRRSILPITLALLAGSLCAAVSAVVILLLFRAPPEIVASIAPKSTTAPIAMELSKSLGGLPSLTAVLVILAGITGAIIVTPLMNAFRIKNYAARGLAVGVASHGIGTARAFQVSEVGGTFAGIAMGLNGAVTSLLVLVWLTSGAT